MYTGPVCLLREIDNSIYKNFLLLHAIIFLLSLPNASENVELAKKLRNAFIHFEQMYGSRHLVYNVHILIRLPDDVAKYGQLDQFSAFPFENYLGLLKKMLREPNCELGQVVHRIFEKKSQRVSEQRKVFPLVRMEHNDGPLMNGMNPSELVQYKVLNLEKFTIKLDRSNRGIMVTEGLW